MSRLRITREQRARKRPVAVWLLGALAAVCVTAGVGAIVVGMPAADSTAAEDVRPAATTSDLAQQAESATVVAASTVEVPKVAGMRIEDARVVLEAAGLGALTSATSGAHVGTGDLIATQEPPAGTLVSAGTDVVLTVAPRSVSTTRSASKKPSPRWVVCIDPGHQSRGDSSPEPVGPGSDESKARVTGGTTGAETEIPEYEIVLQISMNLKERLEARGVRVVMTRTTNDVNLSNSERAKIANKAGADLFVRIHCDGSTDQSMAGASTLYPGENKWTGGFSAESRRAARRIQRSVVVATGAIDRGTKARTDLSGFNWAKVPSVLVECGFLSNPVEDRLLSSPHYQDELAQGIADGIVAHLEGER